MDVPLVVSLALGVHVLQIMPRPQRDHRGSRRPSAARHPRRQSQSRRMEDPRRPSGMMTSIS